MKIVDDDGNELPRDGETFGHLVVKGPSVAKAYFKQDEGILDAHGWFDTYPEDDATTFSGAWGVFAGFPSGTVIVSDIERGLFVLRPR